MHISIQHHNDQFNIDIASKQGAEAFLSIKGCRIKEGGKGRFVSMPASKNGDKWWNHVWANDKFQAAVIDAYDASKPKTTAKRAAPEDDDIPY